MKRFAVLTADDFTFLYNSIFRSRDDQVFIAKLKHEVVLKFRYNGYASMITLLSNVLPLMIAVRNQLPLNTSPFAVWLQVINSPQGSGRELESMTVVCPRYLDLGEGAGYLELDIQNGSGRCFSISVSALKELLPSLEDWLNEHTD